MTGVLAAVSTVGSLTANAAPEVANGMGLNTELVTCTVRGGVLPITYEWMTTGGDADLLAPTIPNGRQTRFAGISGPPPSGETYVVSAFCRVTDAGGRMVDSNVIGAVLRGASGGDTQVFA